MRSNSERQTTISVILPVYNVERWIGACIESLKKQKLEGLEFIFVDDCGDDDSMKAVRTWAAEDSRVHIIKNEKNIGSGPSRNRGIEAARGEYLSFIDPDDWVSDDFYELLYDKAGKTGCDIVKGSRIMTGDAGSQSSTIKRGAVNRFNNEIRNRNRPLYCIFRGEHHTAIYKRDLFQDDLIRYGDSRVSEDTSYLLKVCLSTEDIVTEDEAVYYYRQRDGAATESYSLMRSTEQLKSLEERIRCLKTKDSQDDGLHADNKVFYFKNVLRYYLTCYYYASESEDISDEDNLAYISKLRSALQDTGVCTVLMHDIPELDILLKYGYAIPPNLKKGNKTGTAPLERWTEFIAGHKGEMKKEYYRVCAAAYLHCLASSRKGIIHRRNSRKMYRMKCTGLLRRLEKKDRARVLLYVPAAGAELVAGKAGQIGYEIVMASRIRTYSSLMQDKPESEKLQSSKPDISVVVPMYNCEQFVPGLLRMFSKQRFKNFEVICVVDGATDGTEGCVREYCKTDPRIRCLTRDNGGAGAARNTGMEAARGKYIIFSDADDIYGRDYLGKLFKAAEAKNAEIAICCSETVDHSVGERRNLRSFNKRTMKEGRVYSLKNKKSLLKTIDVQVSNKLFLLEYIRSLGIRFSEVPSSNDLFFSKAAVAGAERIVVVHDDLVTIRRNINPSSISSNRSMKTQYALPELQKIYDWLKEQDLLRFCKEDYIEFFDATVNYELKNGVSPLFSQELARMLSCNEPWRKIKREQIRRVLPRSLGDAGMEARKPIRRFYSSGRKSKIRARNEIIDQRNENKRRMQEMIRGCLDEMQPDN